MTMRNLSISFLLLGVLAIATPAAAQNATTGAIQGVVTDASTGEGLAGVTVVVTSPALQGTQSAITDGSGVYKISNLPPGTYSATFYYSDITVRRNNIGVNINMTTPGYVKMNTSQAGGEVIVIDDKAPTVDVTSTTQGVRLDQDYTKNIPVPGRTFEDALGAAPGSAGDGMGVSFSGSSSLENSYVVDGVNTTSLRYGTVGNALINDFIEEIEIITGGYNAEYGRATGGVINVVTKSGSNEFQGSVFSYFTPGAFVASAKRAPREATSIDVESNLAYAGDFGFELGGPVIKDKVWFYVGFAPQLARRDYDRITKRMTDCRELMPNGTLSDCEPTNYDANGNRLDNGLGDGLPDRNPDTGFYIWEDIQRRRLAAEAASYQFVSKVNFAVAPEHQGQVSLIGTPSTGQVPGIWGTQEALAYDYFQLTSDLSGKWTSKFNDNETELEAVLGWHRDSIQADAVDDDANGIARQDLLFGTLDRFSAVGTETSDTLAACRDRVFPDPYYAIENCPVGYEGYSVGGSGGLLDTTEQRFSARVGATQRIKARGGSHEVKGGLELEDNRLDAVRDISGGVYYQNLYGNQLLGGSYNQTTAIRWVRLAPPNSTDPDFDQICMDSGTFESSEMPCQFLGRDPVSGQTLNWSAYLRDSWQPMPNLTLNYGLRYEEQRLRYAKSLQGTLDPFTQIPRGSNAMTLTGMFAPRIGAVYDWTKEGRGKVYGHWGRFYEAIPMNINQRSFGGEVTYQQDFPHGGDTGCGEAFPDSTSTLAGGPGCEGATATSSTIFGAGTLVAPGIKAQYLDEVIVGADYEILEDLRLGISIQDRRLGRILEDVSVDNADTYIIANPGEVPQSEIDRLEDELAGLVDDPTDPGDAYSVLANQIDQFKKIRVFDKPRRDYRAVQLTAVKRFSRNFFAQGSYTYSRTLGNFQGLFSSANGQVDPNITSQFDLIELTANQDGPLPQDRPHYVKLDGYYKFDFKRAGELTTGIRFRALSGTARDALGRHYLYGFSESFLLPRGSMGRNPFNWGFDLHVGFARKLTQGMALEVFADLFNVINDQGTGSIDDNYTLDPANPIVGGSYEDLVFAKAVTTQGAETRNPVSRWENFLNTTGRYGPRAGRIGARLTF